MAGFISFLTTVFTGAPSFSVTPTLVPTPAPSPVATADPFESFNLTAILPLLVCSETVEVIEVEAPNHANAGLMISSLFMGGVLFLTLLNQTALYDTLVARSNIVDDLRERLEWVEERIQEGEPEAEEEGEGEEYELEVIEEVNEAAERDSYDADSDTEGEENAVPPSQTESSSSRSGSSSPSLPPPPPLPQSPN